MFKLKQILPLGVLLLSGCTTVIDEHQECSSDPVYIYFTTQSGIKIDADITATRSGTDESLTIGVMGIGNTSNMANPNWGSATSINDLRQGLQNDKYMMTLDGAITPSEGVETPTFPPVGNSAVSIFAYYPYIDTIIPQYDAEDGLYLPLAIDGQTDYLYVDTTCKKINNIGSDSIDLVFHHALIRLDVIATYAEIGGSTDGDVEEGDDDTTIGGDTEGDVNADHTNVGYTDDFAVPNSSVLAPEYRTCGAALSHLRNDFFTPAKTNRSTVEAEEPNCLTVTLYTDNDGTGKLFPGPKDEDVIINQSDIYWNNLNYSEKNKVEHSIEIFEESDADTVTFYLLPGTTLYRIDINDTPYYPITQGNGAEEPTIIDDGYQLPKASGCYRRIKIKY